MFVCAVGVVQKYPCCIITAKGQPDVATRLFLKKVKVRYTTSGFTTSYLDLRPPFVGHYTLIFVTHTFFSCFVYSRFCLLGDSQYSRTWSGRCRSVWSQDSIRLHERIEEYVIRFGITHNAGYQMVTHTGTYIHTLESHRMTVTRHLVLTLLCPPFVFRLGVRPSDLDKYKIPEQCRLDMSDHDIKTGKELLEEEFIQKNPDWVRELKLMIETKKKAEIQALSSFGFQYLSNVYLPLKLQHGGWI